MKALIVEDEAIIAMEIQNMLENLGYEVVTIVDTGEESIQKAGEERPDIVLMDVRIKGQMDGIEAAKAIWLSFNIPIVFSTAYLDKNRIEEIKLEMPFGHVLKPIQERDLEVSLEMTRYISKITIEKRQAEKKLQKSELQYRSLFNSMTEGVCQHELVYNQSRKVIDYRITNVNPQYETILGLKSVDVIGKLATEVYQTDKAPFLEIYTEVVKTGKPVKFETDLPLLKKHFSISAFSPAKNQFATVFEDITENKLLTSSLQAKTESLNERVKELKCLYGISKLVERPNISQDEIFDGVVDLIQEAMQFPSISIACLVIKGQEFKTEIYRLSKWKLTAEIFANSQIKGSLEIGYLDESREFDSDPFLIEERNLIQEIAERLGKIIERYTAHENLQNAMQQLQFYSKRLKSENRYLKDEIKSANNFGKIISKNKKFLKILTMAEQVASSTTTVLILGETGTGKELLARLIHELSVRKGSILVKVNCATLPANLIENELFGHNKGAFTGAINSQKGRFELADNGTIFLDEIGDLPLELQSKLLRVLQEGEFERLGGTKSIKVNVRILAATNKNLKELCQKGKFREDLFYRLNVFPLESLPLRDRKDDIPLLAKHFIEVFNAKIGKNIKTIPQPALKILQEYCWPGNIRELENIIERGVILSSGEQLELGDWFLNDFEIPGASVILPLDDLQKQHIIRVLQHTGGRVGGKTGSAELLGLSRTTLLSRMKKLGIKINRSTVEI